jgi:hypothetical protein
MRVPFAGPWPWRRRKSRVLLPWDSDREERALPLSFLA